MSESVASGNPASSEKTSVPTQLAPPEEEGEGWSKQKSRPKSSIRKKEPGEGKEGEDESKIAKKKAPSAGIEKEKIVDPGYLYVKIRMLNDKQILKYFCDLKEMAVVRHEEVYGEKDTSYLNADIEINVISSITTGQYGHAHCFIYNDEGHKMYNVFLGKGPLGDFPRIHEIKNQDGTTTIESEPFLTPYRCIMKPDQVAVWVTDQENKFKKGEVTEEAFKALMESYTIYRLHRQWKEAKPEDKATDQELLGNIANAIVRVKSTQMLSEGKTEQEVEAASEAYMQEVNEAIEAGTHVDLLEKDIPGLKAWGAYASEVEIESDPLYVTKSAKGTSPGHLFIINDKIPAAVTEEGLRALFTRYNTQEGGDHSRSYPTHAGPNTKKMREAYPHVWITVEPSGKRTANIAFSDAGVNDAEYAYHLKRKFFYPLGVNAEGKEVKWEGVIEWWDDNRRKPRLDQTRRTGNTWGQRREYQPRQQRDATSGSKVSTPQMSSLQGVLGAPSPAPLSSMARPPMLGPSFGPLPGASANTIADAAEGKLPQEGVVSAWGTGKLSLQRLLEDEDGNLHEPIMYHTTASDLSTRRGYESTYNAEKRLVRRDDGSLPW